MAEAGNNKKQPLTSEAQQSVDRTADHTILDNTDYAAEERLDKLDIESAKKSGDISRSASTCSGEHARDERIVVSFADNDPDFPSNWSRMRKLYVVFAGIILVLNSTIGSSLPSGATAETQKYFHVQGEEKLVLPNSIYLVGYVLGYVC